MARIPDKYSLSQQPSLRSGRQIATYDATGIGRGLEAFGQGLANVASDINQQNNAVDLARAEAYSTKGLLDTQNQFKDDPEYSTFSKRGDPVIDKTYNDGATLIRDPKMRERWLATKQEEAVRAKDWLRDQANTKQRGAEITALDDANQVNYNLVIDPNTPEDTRTKARADISGAIDMAEHSGRITPEEASKRRELFVQKAYDEQAVLAAKEGKLSLPDPDALTQAMVKVESQGQTDAVSPAGAIGLMQVIPGTAAGIAKEIGDPNFPSDPEKQKEYLKDPDVSLMYGKRYMHDMLTKYNGDEEAALIAYNGGPGKADAWIKAGRDDSVLPEETASYYKKVLGELDPTTKAGVKLDAAQVSTARSYLQSHTNKDASHIAGLKDQFAVKLSNMLQDAPPDIRDKLGLFSGFRSNERQNELWQAALKKYGSPEAARKWVAPPGHSKHNEGFAADLAYNGDSLSKAPPEVVNWLHSNAGKYGLSFPLSNENWHIEDADARSAGPRKSYPDYWSKVSPQARIQASDMAVAQDQKRQQLAFAELKANQQQTKDDFNLLIATNPRQLSQQTILNNPTIDNGDKASLINSLNSALKENAGVNDFITEFGTGKKINVNPYNNDQTNIVDKASDQMMASVSEEKRPLVASSIISQTGYIPKSIQADVRRGMATTDVNEMSSALATADSIQRMAPTSFGAMDGHEQAEKNLQAYRHYAFDMGYSTDEAARKVVSLNDPEMAKQREAVMKSKPITDFIKNTDSSTVASVFSGVPFMKPGVGSTPDQQQISVGYNPEGEQAIVADYKGILEESIADAGGDTDLGKKMADERFKKMYGPSSFSVSGDNTIVKLPPEKAYPADVSGSHDYIKQQAMDDLKAEKIDATNIYLQPYEQTERDFAAGKPANYQLFYEQDGKLNKFPHPFVADPNKANETAIKQSSEIQKLNVNDAKELQGRMKDAAARKEGSPDWMKAIEIQNEYQKFQMEKANPPAKVPAVPNGNLQPEISPEDGLFNF